MCQALLSLPDMDNFNPHKEPYEVETHVIPISWLKKMRHREIKNQQATVAVSGGAGIRMPTVQMALEREGEKRMG